jgi:predicted nicotinamide N-methyase
LDHGKLWVELGSGVGLIGLMLHKLGIENIVVTDIVDLVPTMEKNVEANGVLVQSLSGRRKNEKSLEDCSSMPTAVVVEPLLWNDDVAIGHIQSAGPIDYIVPCDCIYSEASAVDLVLTMDKLAGPETTIICLSEVRNQAAQDIFLEQAKVYFYVDLIPSSQWQAKVTDLAFDGTLNLYRLSKSIIGRRRKSNGAREISSNGP